ncbi:MAG: adenylosuccinate lyase [Spirochaetes bacterium]|nr:adenylosuccinate lyase [Spirochaetota bacterium]
MLSSKTRDFGARDANGVDSRSCFGPSLCVQRSIFSNLSPLDHRYYLANRELFDRLSGYLSEDATVTYIVRVEAALLDAHVKAFFDGARDLRAEVAELSSRVKPEEVYAEEEHTQHNIRAVVNVTQRYLPESLRPFVHLGATSMDVLDTATALRYREVVANVVLPLLESLQRELIGLGRRELDTAQVGRTHGQHAVPITFGFAVSSYVARLGAAIEEIRRRATGLVGKLSGAVGAYNATSVLTADPRELERRVLSSLGLEPADVATQIVPPEPMLHLLHAINTAFGIIANIADDFRHLQRSEIAEVAEAFGEHQVGSSTMPQKRNPWNSEHVKSLWKAFAPRIMTAYMDQISEHQRDLSNSASSRFIAEYVSGFVAACERMRRVAGRLVLDHAQMRKNLSAGGDSVLAEPAYILLALSGLPDAHEAVRRATLAAANEEISLKEVLSRDADTWRRITDTLVETNGADAEDFFSHPERYTGRARDTAAAALDRFERLIDEASAR